MPMARFKQGMATARSARVRVSGSQRDGLQGRVAALGLGHAGGRVRACGLLYHQPSRFDQASIPPVTMAMIPRTKPSWKRSERSSTIRFMP